MGPETTTPGRGSVESAGWFRVKLDELELGKAELARLLLSLGDDRQFDTILRCLGRMATGEARVSGEMRATLNYMARMRVINGRRIEELEQQCELLSTGRMRTHENWGDGEIDTTRQSFKTIQAWLDDMRALPPELVGERRQYGAPLPRTVPSDRLGI